MERATNIVAVMATGFAVVSFAEIPRVAAQPAPPGGPTESSRARIDCFLHATGPAGLETDKAVDLCVGASSDAPARCFDEATDSLALADEQGVRLCRLAESTAPVTCGLRLEDLGIEDRELVGYCAAVAWPLVVVPSGGEPACVQSGLDRTNLSEQEVVRLCRGSTSTGPIECYEAGEDQTSLDDRRLVTLCAPMVVSAPVAMASRGVGRCAVAPRSAELDAHMAAEERTFFARFVEKAPREGRARRLRTDERLHLHECVHDAASRCLARLDADGSHHGLPNDGIVARRAP